MQKVPYFTMNMLVENIKVARLKGRPTNFIQKLASYDLLIINGIGMKKLDGRLQNDFEKITDNRCGDKSLIICSQLPIVDWYQIFQSKLIAEACLNKQKTLRIELKGENIRKMY